MASVGFAGANLGVLVPGGGTKAPKFTGSRAATHRPPSSNVLVAYTGEVAERLNAPVSKTGMGGFVHRGFESLPLRSDVAEPVA